MQPRTGLAASTPLKLVPRCVERGRGEKAVVERGGGPSGGSRREGEISGRERSLGTSQSKDPANRVSSSLCLLLYFTSFLIPPNSTVQEPGRRHEKPEETLASLLHLSTLDPPSVVNRGTRSIVYWLVLIENRRETVA